jgi:hypothetical protein
MARVDFLIRRFDGSGKAEHPPQPQIAFITLRIKVSSVFPNDNHKSGAKIFPGHGLHEYLDKHFRTSA